MRRPVQFLTRDEEMDLARRWRDHGDIRARDRIIVCHQPLADKFARKFARIYQTVDECDLASEGTIGIMKAVRDFDPSRGIRFATYAQYWIKAQITDFILRNASVVRNGMTAEAKREFFAGNPTAITYSMNVHLVENGDEWGDSLPDEGPLPDEVAQMAIDGDRRSAALHSAIKRLKPRERSIVQARFLSDEDVTLDDMGRLFGISKERIRQIQNVALGKVRAAMGAA